MNILKLTLPLVVGLLSAQAIAGEGNMEADQKYYRADDIRGYDVFGSKGLKVGDITDFALSLEEEGSVRYVIITTGGFADLFGAERAVPVDAVQFKDGVYHLDVIKQEFLKAPVLRSDAMKALSSTRMQSRLAALYGVETIRADLGSSDDLVLWSDLVNDEVSLDDRRFGIVENALVNLNEGKLAYVFVRPLQNTPFYSSIDQRYAVPISDIEDKQWKGIELSLNENALYDAISLEAHGSISREDTERGVVYKIM